MPLDKLSPELVRQVQDASFLTEEIRFSLSNAARGATLAIPRCVKLTETLLKNLRRIQSEWPSAERDGSAADVTQSEDS